MQNTLAQIYEEGRSLLGVKYSLFEGDWRFVTSVELHFEELRAVFSAVADDDTLRVMISSLEAEPGEIMVDVSSSLPWSTCLGCDLRWVWQLTNQQGYIDGVRFEFGMAGGAANPIVEFIVVASAIKIFVPARIKAEQALMDQS